MNLIFVFLFALLLIGCAGVPDDNGSQNLENEVSSAHGLPSSLRTLLADIIATMRDAVGRDQGIPENFRNSLSIKIGNLSRYLNGQSSGWDDETGELLTEVRSSGQSFTHRLRAAGVNTSNGAIADGGRHIFWAIRYRSLHENGSNISTETNVLDFIRMELTLRDNVVT